MNSELMQEWRGGALDDIGTLRRTEAETERGDRAKGSDDGGGTGGGRLVLLRDDHVSGMHCHKFELYFILNSSNLLIILQIII